LTYPCQDFLRRGKIGKRLADVPPTLAAIDVDEDSCIQGDVLSVLAGAGMNDSIRANHLGARVAEDSELAVDNSVPDKKCVLAVVHAYGDETRIEGNKLFCVPRELAQLTRAVGSPIATVENQKQALAAHRGQVKRPTVLVPECEIGGELAHGRKCVRLGKDLLCRGDSAEQEKHNKPGAHRFEHCPYFTSVWLPRGREVRPGRRIDLGTGQA
jgi:hypothetical protein